MRKSTALVFLPISLFIVALAQNLPDAPSAVQKNLPVAKKTTTSKPPAETGWPRIITAGAETLTIYQPQVDKWEENRLSAYAAVEVKLAAKKEAPANYGVVWFSARTEVDKVNRAVTLDQLQIDKIHFPAAAERDAEILAVLKQKLPGTTKVISLDRLQAAMAANNPTFKGVDVKNDPPPVIFTTKPSLLVTIDGEPKLAPVKTTELQRVINSTAVIVFDPDKKRYYLRVMDWWLQADTLEGPWTYADKLSKDMKRAEEYVADTTKSQVPEGDDAQSLKKAGKKSAIPNIFIAYKPTELIETKGEPVFKPLAGNTIEYLENTNSNLFRLNGVYYVLLSGRWFKSDSITGVRAFVGKGELPADFAKIPEVSPKASALASIPGTPQAQEGLIANSIPQTATITRSQAKLTVVYDGEASFVPIEGTSMTYARNTSVPVIKVADNQFYSVEAGVWFTAPTPQGPWRVADTVPAAIYTIPASSPMHYVTYAKVYNSTPDVVYVGYTPGYYGTVVSADTDTVVYGTGWYYPPYITPTVWYGYPYTYGVGAGFTWATTTGWSFGFGYGYGYYPYYYPWWGPMGYYGYGWYPYYGWGAWGGAAAANVYGQWGNTAYSRTAAAWANPYTGNYGAASRGGTYNTANGRTAVGGRGYNTNIYTGNTVGYRGGAVYDPNSGIVAGGAAGFAGNRYTGEGSANRGGFAYNTNTNTGIAAGKNNIYAGKDGTVYKYDRNNGNWSTNSGSGWTPTDGPDRSNLKAQQQSRQQGAQRTTNFDTMRSSPSYNRSYNRGGGGGRRR